MSKVDIHGAFEDFLKAQNIRYTSQKKIILSGLLEMDGHFEIDDFLLDYKVKYKKSLSRASVYRVIKQMQDASLIQKIPTKLGKVLYEVVMYDDYHMHLICNQCGDISEIHKRKITDIIDADVTKMGFKPQYYSLHVYAECQKKNCDKNTNG